jgi:hypothetical protein
MTCDFNIVDMSYLSYFLTCDRIFAIAYTVLVIRKQFYIWFYLYRQLKARTAHGIDQTYAVSHNYSLHACMC